MIFEHAGHTARVNDLAWNTTEKYFMGSVGADNVVQVWEAAAELINNECEGMQLEEN